jgi:hypothetical protein
MEGEKKIILHWRNLVNTLLAMIKINNARDVMLTSDALDIMG